MQLRQLTTLTYQCALLIALVSPAVDASDKYPEFSNNLRDGRTVWLNNCETCHAYGTAGAPNPLRPPEWDERVKTPIDTLYEHAINGFYGKTDTFMPPRGGNPALSDADVQSAVDYMLALANFYLSNQE